MASNRALSGYDEFLACYVDPFISASDALHPSVKALGEKVSITFRKQRELMEYGLYNPQPTPDHYMMMDFMATVQNILKFKDYQNDMVNHVKTIQESIVAVGWINAKPAPTQLIRDMRDAGDYYGNRVLTSFKGSKPHLEWLNLWKALLEGLLAFVKEHFLTGFTWAKEAGKVPPTANGGVLPPPPPPPPPADFFNEGDSTKSGSGARQALLADLNQGIGITSKLKSASARKLDSQSPGMKQAVKGGVAGKPVVTQPPKLALEGKKWVVEYQKKNPAIMINNDDMSQAMAIYKCEESGVKVSNKMNGVSADMCKKVTIELEDIISSLECIRCTDTKIVCNGHIPLINLDNCESCQIFLSPSAADVELITSKSSSINVCMLEANGDYKEFPVPEQIKTVFTKDRLKSSVVEKY